MARRQVKSFEIMKENVINLNFYTQKNLSKMRATKCNKVSRIRSENIKKGAVVEKVVKFE